MMNKRCSFSLDKKKQTECRLVQFCGVFFGNAVRMAGQFPFGQHQVIQGARVTREEVRACNEQIAVSIKRHALSLPNGLGLPNGLAAARSPPASIVPSRKGLSTKPLPVESSLEFPSSVSIANLEHAIGIIRAAVPATSRTQPPANVPEPPATGGSEKGEGVGKSRAEILQSLAISVREAYLAYELAETTKSKRLQDREAYEYIRGNGLPDKGGDLGELTDYEVPDFDTWARYLRRARNALGDHKK
ncbi:MAG TPA: hypothetical protein VFW87_09125 [Pirellulales bacterium]|nr:hypothetical protein [Pirellulales bacterium]